eukprot:1814264-Amphidinium_carterae.2
MALARSPVALKMRKSWHSNSLTGGQPDTSVKPKLLVTTDNSAALQMCTQGPRASFRTLSRQISIRGLHVHELVQRGVILLLFVPTQLRWFEQGAAGILLQEFPDVPRVSVISTGRSIIRATPKESQHGFSFSADIAMSDDTILKHFK